MKRDIFNILMMLLTLSAAFSCDALVMNDAVTDSEGDMSLAITGTVSDLETDAPLEGIKISFTAFPKGNPGGVPLQEKNVYSDNHGTYMVEASGFSHEITILITATDTEDVYEGSVNEIDITWSGVSFDSHQEKFIVNDCDFKLEKKK
ncbi:MAG: hypothetical protein IJ394_02025 [Bacteroidales bacterium]|nr:hypothetical protein [Bacteroidales bacterium]